jgi:hypothetical protein
MNSDSVIDELANGSELNGHALLDRLFDHLIRGV